MSSDDNTQHHARTAPENRTLAADILQKAYTTAQQFKTPQDLVAAGYLPEGYQAEDAAQAFDDEASQLHYTVQDGSDGSDPTRPGAYVMRQHRDSATGQMSYEIVGVVYDSKAATPYDMGLGIWHGHNDGSGAVMSHVWFTKRTDGTFDLDAAYDAATYPD